MFLFLHSSRSLPKNGCFAWPVVSIIFRARCISLSETNAPIFSRSSMLFGLP